MAFVLQDVINEIEETRSLEPLKKLKKENLVKVAAHYGITPAVGATKSHILDLIKDHCVENDIIDEVEEKPTAETAEVLKLRLEIEREERRLAREEAQRARYAEKALQDAQFAEAQKAREAARELKLAELKEARELRELELKAEADKEAAACEHELKMAGLGIHSPKDKASAFDPARNIRLVPPFQEKETLGLVLALEHFDVYLGSTPFKIKVYTDHNPLTFLKTMKNKNQRLVRWSLALQEYNLEIQHIPGSENVVADALSRCIG